MITYNPGDLTSPYKLHHTYTVHCCLAIPVWSCCHLIHTALITTFTYKFLVGTQEKAFIITLLLSFHYDPIMSIAYQVPTKKTKPKVPTEILMQPPRGSQHMHPNHTKSSLVNGLDRNQSPRLEHAQPRLSWLKKTH